MINVDTLFIGSTGAVSSCVVELFRSRSQFPGRTFAVSRTHRDTKCDFDIFSDWRRLTAYQVFGKDMSDRRFIVGFPFYDERAAGELIQKFGSRETCLVIMSSAGIYQPISRGRITEKSPLRLRPESSYLASKIEMEKRLIELCRARSIPLVILRLGHTVSKNVLPTPFPGLGTAILSTFAKQKKVMWFDEFVRRTWTLTNPDFLTEVIEAIMHAKLADWQQDARVYNVGGSFGVSWADLLKRYELAAGARANWVSVSREALDSVDESWASEMRDERLARVAFDLQLLERDFGLKPNQAIERRRLLNYLDAAITGWKSDSQFEGRKWVQRALVENERRISQILN